MKNTGWMISVLSFALAANSFAAGTHEAKGIIKWEDGVVSATGYGTASSSESNKAKARLNAVRAAEASAQRALLEAVKGVRIDSQTLVQNAMLKEDVIKTKVEGMIKGAVKTREQVDYVDEAPLATVEMKMCLTGTTAECSGRTLLTDVLDVGRKPEPDIVPPRRIDALVLSKDPVSLPAVTETAKSESMCRSIQYDSTQPVTSVILNLNGSQFTRELLPVVVTRDEGGLITVYSVKSVKPSVVRTFGAVRYADTIDNARKIEMVGSNPIIICADSVTKENMIMIRKSDAGIVRETTSHGNNYLGDAKVIITSK